MFWKYFQSLRFLLIDFPGIFQGLVRGASISLDLARDDIFWLREQFLPSLTENLNEMGSSRGLHKYIGETDEQFRFRIEMAFLFWKQTQSKAGLQDFLMEYTGLENLFFKNIDGERWAEFSIDAKIPDQGFGDQQMTVLFNIVDELKPARSKLAGINLKTYISDCQIPIALSSIAGLSQYSNFPVKDLFFIPICLTIGNYCNQSYLTIKLSDVFDELFIIENGGFESQAIEIVDSGSFLNPAVLVSENGYFYERII